MALSDITLTTMGALRDAGAYLADLSRPSVRLGVTGLARSGKTVFITALVRNLVAGAPLPFFGPAAEGRILRAYLEPQPDDTIPRFAYEEHLAALAQNPPVWPESTKRISQLRVTIEYEAASPLLRRLGSRTLHLDIVDYPGEWLLDLPLQAMTFADWSRQTLAGARMPARAAAADPFLAFHAGLDGQSGEAEQLALTGARLYTQYIVAARRQAIAPTLGPGRFLLPGDLEGSPLLTFFPLDPALGGPSLPALRALLERRFNAYKTHVVLPFFRDHFARLDRQIVLVDALSAISAGPAALDDLGDALGDVLTCFRPGGHTWYSALLPRRIDRILFAATKADHLHHTSHDRLERILGDLTRQAAARASARGADVTALALAALRATEEGQMPRGGEKLPCIIGTPLPGERIGTTTYDGVKRAAIFPGDLEADLAATLARKPDAGPVEVVRFRPTRVPADGPDGQPAPWPNIRLDRALDYLLGDLLA